VIEKISSKGCVAKNIHEIEQRQKGEEKTLLNFVDKKARCSTVIRAKVQKAVALGSRQKLKLPSAYF